MKILNILPNDLVQKAKSNRQAKIATYTKPKVFLNKLEKRAGFWNLPIKYSLLGFFIPIPLASFIGFIYGIGLSIRNKFKGN
jgi:hypothetical protein